MARHRTHSIEFKRQVAHDYVAGETLHSLAKRHDLSRTLIRIWVQKYEAGAFDEDAAAVDLIETYEARIAALERLVGKQTLEIEFLKGALKHTPRTRNAPTSVITGLVGVRHFGPNLRRTALRSVPSVKNPRDWRGLVRF